MGLAIRYQRIIELDCGSALAGPQRDAEAIVFIHGFGSAKEHFRHAFSDPSLDEFSLLAVDLVGFGASRGPEDFEYGMEDQARVVLKALDALKIESFHLCAHSMGGLVAMRMAELEAERVLSFANLEGNLTPEDCFLSGKVAGFKFEEFDGEGRRRIEEELREAGREDATMREYLETFRRAPTVALHRSAVHTVADSSTDLVARFARIKKVCYIYGERNEGLYRGEKLLLEKGVPLFYVQDAGHSMATENPHELYRILAAFIKSLA